MFVCKVALALVAATCATVALAADTLLLQLAVQAAVLHLHLRGVDLW